jgi:hypothetical protein
MPIEEIGRLKCPLYGFFVAKMLALFGGFKYPRG